MLHVHNIILCAKMCFLKSILFILFCLVTAPLFSQYFLRGEIKDTQGNTVAFAKIKLKSKGSSQFNSGSSGGFGIPLSLKQDTITVMLDGYDTLTQWVTVNTFQTLVLQPVQSRNNQAGKGLLSLTKSITNNKPATTVFYGDETYTSLAENDFVSSITAPETSIALNINSASYSNIRRFLNMKTTVPTDGVRIEEMLNYFNLNKTNRDTTSKEFRFETSLTTCPWNDSSQLLFVSIHAPKLDFHSIPPAKFIFLIDVSGSMDKDNRLPLVQAAFKYLVNNLREQDTVGIVTYGGFVGIALPPTSGAEKEKIIHVIDGLHADGDTPGSQAIQTAYELAEKIADSKSNNRVILATDGDFNIGQTSDKDLEAIVNFHKQKGIYLTCLGTGMGNYKDSRLEMLAKTGNGNFAYIDNMKEAQKTMVTEFAKNMYAVANNAWLRVLFNEAAVKRYRLIGYDNRKDALDDTTLTEGGDIGSGQSNLIVFQIEPTTLSSHQPLATLQMHYRLPQNGVEQVSEFTAASKCISFDSAQNNLRFATAVCMFGSLLKHSKFALNYNWNVVEQLARNSYDRSSVPEKEFVDLTAKAKAVYTQNNNEKRRKKNEE